MLDEKDLEAIAAARREFEKYAHDRIAGTTGNPLQTVRVAGDTRALDELMVEMKPLRAQLQTPSIGRVVHYVLSHNDLLTIGGQVENAGKHRPAHIVEVHHHEDGAVTCDLAVMLGVNDGPSLIVRLGGVVQGLVPGTWHWPEKV